jgi:hypothetical protein
VYAGQLGTGDLIKRYIPTTIQMPNGVKALAVAAFSNAAIGSDSTHVLLVDGTVAYFGATTSTPTLYDLPAKAVAIDKLYALLEDGSIIFIRPPGPYPYFLPSANAIGEVMPLTGYLCGADISVSASESGALSAAVAAQSGTTSTNAIILQPGVHSVITGLNLENYGDVVIRGNSSSSASDTNIECGDNVAQCFSFVGARSVILEAITLRHTPSVRERKLQSSTGNAGLYFDNIATISLSNVRLEGFQNTNGAALHVNCTNQGSCADVQVINSSFISNHATQYGKLT